MVWRYTTLLGLNSVASNTQSPAAGFRWSPVFFVPGLNEFSIALFSKFAVEVGPEVQDLKHPKKLVMCSKIEITKTIIFVRLLTNPYDP